MDLSKHGVSVLCEARFELRGHPGDTHCDPIASQCTVSSAPNQPTTCLPTAVPAVSWSMVSRLSDP
eukprot:5582692-Prymnesium_polylepis.1